MRTNLIITLVLLNLCVLCQNETKKWCFGVNCGLDFVPGSPTVMPGAANTSTLGCSSIADNQGNLLFYSDGKNVYTASHTLMANGAGLPGGNGIQTSVILPRPGSQTEYYLFTVGTGTTGPGFHYSVIDMSLSGGSGSVTVKSAVINSAACMNRITAGRHCNGIDYWVLVKQWSGALLAYSITANGVSAPVSSPVMPLIHDSGWMELSPNSRKLAVNDYDIYINFHFDRYLYIADFDNSTGLVSNVQLIINADSWTYPWPFSVEFSGDSRWVYYTYLGVSKIDLCSMIVTTNNELVWGAEELGYQGPESNSVVTTCTSCGVPRGLQYAADGKIYVTSLQPTSSGLVLTSSLSAISNPNATGSLSVYHPGAVSMGTLTAGLSLPNIPGFYFEQKPGKNFTYSATPSACNSLSFQPGLVCAATGYSVTGYQWDFGDPSTGSANSSTLMTPVHVFSANGTYAVKLIRTFHNACFTSKDTITQTVMINQPVVSITGQTHPCAVNNSTAFVSGGSGSYTYSWMPSGGTTSVASILNPGSYTVAVFDTQSQCRVFAAATLTTIVLSASATGGSLSCFAIGSTTAAASVSGGSGTYSYTWQGSASNGQVGSGFTAGTYTVHVLDIPNQCTASASFTVTQPSPVMVTATLSAQTLCAGNSVSAGGSATGGTGSYMMSWSNGAQGPATTFTPGTGTQTLMLTATDANNCVSSSGNLVLTVFPLPTISISGATTCPGIPAVLTASGATKYTWYPSGISTSTFTANPASNIIYTVSGTDKGCTGSTTVFVTVHTVTPPVISYNQICAGQALSVSGTPGVSSSWSGPLGFTSSSPSFTIPNAGTNHSGIYSLVITDTNSCIVSNSVSVFIQPVPKLAISGPTAACIGDERQITVSGAAVYVWINGSSANTITASMSSGSMYSVKGTDNNGCSATASLNILWRTCTGIDEFSGSAFRLFPNPSSGSFQVMVSFSAELLLFDVTGREVFRMALSPGVNEARTNLATGTYFYHIVSVPAISVPEKNGIVIIDRD